MARSVTAIIAGIIIWLVSRELGLRFGLALYWSSLVLAGFATSTIAGRSHRGHGLALAGIIVVLSKLIGAPSFDTFVSAAVVPMVAIMVGSEIIARIGNVRYVMSDRDRRLAFTCSGFVCGAFVGFLTRPSAFIIGQLPFETVLSRGGNLSGVDQLLVPTAQASFNQMLFLAVLGAAIGFCVPLALRAMRGAQLAVVGAAAQPTFLAPAADSEILNNQAVLKMIAAGLGDEILLEKMKYSRCDFGLSSSDLAQLKQGGASDRVIASMLHNQAERGRAL